jgi:hypothetical protein
MDTAVARRHTTDNNARGAGGRSTHVMRYRRRLAGSWALGIISTTCTWTWIGCSILTLTLGWATRQSASSDRRLWRPPLEYMRRACVPAVSQHLPHDLATRGIPGGLRKLRLGPLGYLNLLGRGEGDLAASRNLRSGLACRSVCFPCSNASGP